MANASYTGHCLCGEVEFEVTGAPAAMGYCHAAMIPELEFEPALHVHYQETVLRIKDGKPKMGDMPKEMGGSGLLLQE